MAVAIVTAGVTVTGNETPAGFRRSNVIISLLGEESFCGVSLTSPRPSFTTATSHSTSTEAHSTHTAPTAPQVCYSLHANANANPSSTEITF